MPTAKKIAWAQLKVGILAIVALVIIGVLVFLLTGEKRLFGGDAVLYTYFEDAQAMAKGSAVRLNGVLIGQVKAVELSGSKEPKRTIRITMSIDGDKVGLIPNDSEAVVAAPNVLGAKFINVRRGTSTTPLQSGQEIRARDLSNFDDVVEAANNLLAQLQSILKRVDAVVQTVEVGKGTIGKLLVDDELYTRINRIAGDVERISKAMSTDQGTLGKLIYDDALYRDVRGSMARVDALIADMQAGNGTAGKLLKDPALYNEMQASIKEARKLLEDLNAGKGSAGKLLKSDELHKQLQGTITRLDNMLDKVNAGQGTIGQLLVNQQLYDSLNGATGEMRELLKAVRQDPKKYLRIKLSLF